MAASDSRPTAVLLLGGLHHEVDVSPDDGRGALRNLLRQVEQKFGAGSGSYNLYDERGRQVNDMQALLQAMKLARNGKFALEVRETAVGKAARQMQAMVNAAEQRLAAKVDAAVLELSKALESMEAKQMDQESSSTLLQEIRAQFDNIIAQGMEDLPKPTLIAEGMGKSLEDLDKELLDDMNQLASDDILADGKEEDQATLQAEVKSLEARIPAARTERGDAGKITEAGLMMQPPMPPHAAQAAPLPPQAQRTQSWLEATDIPKGFSYSSKSSFVAVSNVSSGAVSWSSSTRGAGAPFAHSLRQPRTLERVAGTRSMPTLPPLAV
mmetsp:Transcript_25289/g.58723  ORF Transcript_25289/g.58723 Transcript_25289/m.58723 type:complete len:325 (-) Transcript_25289:34-1008(-)